LTGSLPDTIGQWTVLSHFDAAQPYTSSDLNGTLPDAIGKWTNLTYFDVSGNNLTGMLPKGIGNWSLIETAAFNSNEFTGTVPYAICQYIDANLGFLGTDSEINCTCISCYTF
jgi:hypothetical protein